MQKKTSNNQTPARRKISHIFGASKEKQYLIEALGSLVRAGVSINEALEAIEHEIRSSAMRRVVAFIREDVQSGRSLSRSLEETQLFRPNIISLIKLGEESGKLTDNLQVIAEQEKKNREFRSRITSAMLYPVFVLALTMFVGIGIAWFVLPKLAIVFSQLSVELPVLTRILIDLGLFLKEYGMYVVPAAIVLLLVMLYFLFFFRKTRHMGQELLFVVPGIRRLIRDIELARFGFLLGSLLEAGMPISEALTSIADSTMFPRFQKFYVHLRDSVMQGNSFQKTLGQYKKSERIIPYPTQRIIISAEQSGTLSASLLEIGADAEKRTQNATKNIAVILEPILLVIVWIGVVLVAFAVILPIYELVGGLNI